MLLILALLAGFVGCFSIGNLLSWRFASRDKAAGYFGLICLTFAVYTLLQIAVLSSSSLTAVAPLLRVQGAVLATSFGLVSVFGAHFSKRQLDRFDYLVASVYAALAIYSLTSPCGYWFSSLTSLETLEVPGGRVHHPHGTIAPTYYVSLALQYPLYARQIRDGVRLFRKGARIDGALWAVGMLFILATATHDHAVDFGWLMPPYLGEYPFPLLVLAMGVRYTLKRSLGYQETLRLKSSLAESEARLRDLFDGSADAIIIHELQTGTIIEVNRTASELYGYTAEEFRSLTVAELTAHGFEEAQPRAQALLKEAVEKGEVTFAWQAKRKDGSEFPIEVSLKLTQAAGAQCVVANVHDITERVNAAEALQQEQAFVSTLLNGLPGTFFLYDEGLRLKRWNRNLEQTMGYAPEQLEDMHFGQWCPPGEPRMSMVAAVEHWLSSGRGNPTLELVMMRADGTEVPYLMTTTRLDTREGPMLMGVGQDISGLVHARTALRESEERYRALFESAGDAILLLVGGCFVDCNSQALGVYGCASRELLIGKSPLDFSPEAQPDGRDSDALSRALSAAASSGAAQRFEWVHSRLDGTPFLAEVSLNAVELRGVKHLQANVRDVTEKNRLQERLRQAQRLEAIGHLAGGVAHDFNNLLTPILGNVEMLLAEMQHEDERRNYLEEVLEAADRAKRLTRQLLSFGRRAVLDVASINLSELVCGLERLLKGLLREDIELRMRLEAMDIGICADPSQIEQVLMNLVVNARDAMPKGGWVTIELERKDLDREGCEGLGECAPGSYAVLTVSDSGTGMSSEIKARLFEPFFTTKSVGKGTGLGLATVLGIVQQHRGALTVYSELGKGSTFRVYLPAEHESRELSRPKSTPVPNLNGTECVLVAEDDHAVRMLAFQALRRAGYVVYESDSPESAIALFPTLEPRPVVLLTDVVMPKLSGLELYERLSALEPQLRVLYMSGYSGDTISRHGMLDPHVACLQKPFTVSELLRKLRQVLDSPSN